MKLKEINYQEILEHLRRLDKEENILEYCDHQDKEFEQSIEPIFTSEHLVNYSVLGIDIYKYSKYPLPKQNFIPFIFTSFPLKGFMDCVPPPSRID